jgi:hypothetical protein
MRKQLLPALRFALLALLTLGLFGCPTGLDHPLTEKPDKIDPALIGKWSANDSEAEMLEVSIQKKDEHSYLIEVLESSEGYMLEDYTFIGRVTRLDGRTFLYAKPLDSSDEKYYHYHYHFEKGKLVIQDVGLLVGGVDAVTSTEALRKEVSASLKNPECLSGRMEYVKN